MSAQLVWTVPFCLEQQTVVVDVAQTECVAVRFNGEDFRQVCRRIDRSLEEQGLVAVFRRILQANQQVGFVAGQHEIAVGCHCPQLLFRCHYSVAALSGQQVIISIIGGFHINMERIGYTLIGGCDFHVFLHTLNGEDVAIGSVRPHHVGCIRCFWNNQFQCHCRARQHFCFSILALNLAHDDVLQGIHHVQMEMAFAHATALIGILAGVGAA